VNDAFDPWEALNPATRALLDNIRRTGFVPLQQQGVALARLSYRAGVGASEGPRIPVERVEDLHIASPEGQQIPARLWAPHHHPGLPVVLYLHGGGFVLGGIDTCEGLCRQLAVQADVAVLAIDYRLAPEHPFPAALDDTLCAVRWLLDEGRAHGLDPERLALAGDSAGGTLAATAAHLCRDEGIALRLHAMFYPSVQRSLVTGSYQRHAQGLLLDAELMAWFDRLNGLHARPGQPLDWRREPLNAPSHRDLAPAWIGLAECDPLADDGRLYADALMDAGVPVQVQHYPGTVHDFIQMGRFLPQAAQAHTDMARALKAALD